MSTYIIGDVHGCYEDLMRLLERIQFDAKRDRLIFVGDLINRGPDSLSVLRFVRLLGDSASMVLGNHDISFIAYACGAYHGRGSDFPEMLQAKDAEYLLEWLRHQPLLIHEPSLNAIITHAGIPPRWSIKKAIKQARKAEKKLQGEKYAKYLRKAYKSKNMQWADDFNKYDKFRYRLNGFARIRYCDERGEPDYADKCPLGEQRPGLKPWFELRDALQNDGNTHLIFGHWAALGYYQGVNAICLDSGCVWGNQLTAIELHQDKVIKTQIVAR